MFRWSSPSYHGLIFVTKCDLKDLRLFDKYQWYQWFISPLNKIYRYATTSVTHVHHTNMSVRTNLNLRGHIPVLGHIIYRYILNIYCISTHSIYNLHQHIWKIWKCVETHRLRNRYYNNMLILKPEKIIIILKQLDIIYYFLLLIQHFFKFQGVL